MRPAFKIILLLAVYAVLALTACKKGKDAETAADAKPTRPATPSGTMSLHGTYSQTGSFGVFRDCSTGEQWPVALEGEYEALQSAYLGSGVEPAPLVVTVEGGLDYRSRSDNSGKTMMLIVARFVRIGPTDTCRLLESY